VFGDEPSEPAKKAAEVFHIDGVSTIMELGAAQRRDTIFFARNGFHMYALDYAETGVEAIREKAVELELSALIAAMRHDVGQALTFKNDSFDAWYSHMLFCMALTTDELEFLSKEIRRVLKHDGICSYTVRYTGDAHFGTGIHRGGDFYERGWLYRPFFQRGKGGIFGERI